MRNSILNLPYPTSRPIHPVGDTWSMRTTRGVGSVGMPPRHFLKVGSHLVASGKGLMHLTKEDFIKRAPKYGDILHNLFDSIKERSIRDSKYYSLPLNMQPATSPIQLIPPPPLKKRSSPSMGTTADHFDVDYSTLKANLMRSVTYGNSSTTGFPNYQHALDFGSPQEVKNYPINEENSSISHPLTTFQPTSTDQTHTANENPSPVNMTKANVNNKRLKSKARSEKKTSPTPFFSNLSEDRVDSGRILWDFMYRMLDNQSKNYEDVIRWKNRSKTIFQIIDKDRLAFLWGRHKNTPNMNADKLLRAIRCYYKKDIMRRLRDEKSCYQFVRPIEQLRNHKQNHLINLPIEENNSENDSESGAVINEFPEHSQECSHSGVNTSDRKSPLMCSIMTSQSAQEPTPIYPLQTKAIDLKVEQQSPNDLST
ncbi:Ets DNA-binding protein pokkuri [Nymphon striatum]|nr:Ets DNA-binding protein pokkuri [Nymphon striatum]